MDARCRSFLLKINGILELIMAVVIVVAIIMGAIFLVIDTFNAVVNPNIPFTIDGFLSKSLLIIMGIEFVKMLLLHTPEAVIDVLLFAIARQLIASHAGPIEAMFGVLAVAGIFAVKKFLYIKQEV